jgi:lysophospholipase L1-like esterase
MAQPFSATFNGLAKGEYRVDAYIVDSSQNIVAGQLNHDYATQLGVGDIYVAIGDSITEGYDGIAYNVPPYTNWLQAPMASTDYRNYPQCGVSSGAYQDHWQEASHHITLNDELAAFLGYPVFILNEGFAGITTSGYVSRMGLTQWQNRIAALGANKWLVHLGNNDLAGSPAFQSSLQTIVNSLKGTYGASGTDIVLAIPKNGTSWQPYINNLITANGLLKGPDFNTFYLNHTNPPLVTGIHPNAAGHAQMARLWTLSIMSPENVAVQAAGGQVSVSWADLQLLEPTIAGYIVYYGTNPASLTNVVDVGHVTTALINVPASGSQTYYFAVQGYDNDAYVPNVTSLSSPVGIAVGG